MFFYIKRGYARWNQSSLERDSRLHHQRFNLFLSANYFAESAGYPAMWKTLVRKIRARNVLKVFKSLVCNLRARPNETIHAYSQVDLA